MFARKRCNFSRKDAKAPRRKHNMSLIQYGFIFAIFASCLQDAGKGREQERKLLRDLFFLDGH